MKNHILIVDDNELVLDVTSALIRENNPDAHVREANSIETGMALIADLEKTEGELYKLIVDLDCPEKDSGLQLIPVMRNKFPDSIIILTAGTTLPNGGLYHDEDVRLNKPYLPDELLKAVAA